jgi:hypothetical protein
MVVLVHFGSTVQPFSGILVTLLIEKSTAESYKGVSIRSFNFHCPLRIDFCFLIASFKSGKICEAEDGRNVLLNIQTSQEEGFRIFYVSVFVGSNSHQMIYFAGQQRFNLNNVLEFGQFGSHIFLGKGNHRHCIDILRVAFQRFTGKIIGPLGLIPFVKADIC